MHIHRKTPQDVWNRVRVARKALRNNTRPPAARRSPWRKTTARTKAYFAKMRGARSESLEIFPVEIMWSFIGSLIGMGMLSWCGVVVFDRADNLLLMATFGASAMLLFGAPQAHFAQPRNVIGGHVVSALVGISVAHLCGDIPHIGPALGVAGAIAAMHATGCLHPPGGGTALLMVTGCPAMQEYGYFAILFPTATGAVLLVAVALVVNNLARDRQYPLYWW